MIRYYLDITRPVASVLLADSFPLALMATMLEMPLGQGTEGSPQLTVSKKFRLSTQQSSRNEAANNHLSETGSRSFPRELQMRSQALGQCNHSHLRDYEAEDTTMSFPNS